jgi:hypothetical protein
MAHDTSKWTASSHLYQCRFCRSSRRSPKHHSSSNFRLALRPSSTCWKVILLAFEASGRRLVFMVCASPSPLHSDLLHSQSSEVQGAARCSAMRIGRTCGRRGGRSPGGHVSIRTACGSCATRRLRSLHKYRTRLQRHNPTGSSKYTTPRPHLYDTPSRVL